MPQSAHTEGGDPAAAEAITALARSANRLHESFVLRYAGHVRLTRDLDGLDRLIDSLRQVQTQAQRSAAHAEGRWQALLGIIERRLDEYTHERGAVAQIQAAAGTNDRRASLLTSRARLVLHRYVRHFAGQSRRGRDLELLREMTMDLDELATALRPVSAGIHLRTVAEEIGAVQGFVDFFRAEFEEISLARRSGSRIEQSELLAQLIADLARRWEREVLGQGKATRRLGLIQRLVAALDGALDALLAIAHANMPPEHDEAVQVATARLVFWQAELQATVDAHVALSPSERAEALWNRGEALFAQFRGRWYGELQHPSEQTWLSEMADALDEVERQQVQYAESGVEVPVERLARLRDGLVLVEKSFDAATALVQGA
ncbi:MAG: hypothetical protein EXR77_12845 [Myxococcales bacterium]|nr:hypothetical protein [Myxococcales bacterium]